MTDLLLSDTIPTERPEQDQEVAALVARLVTRAVRVAERHHPADVAVLLCEAHLLAARLPVFDRRLCDAVAGQLSSVSPTPKRDRSHR